jgi:hypothetical protein
MQPRAPALGGRMLKTQPRGGERNLFPAHGSFERTVRYLKLLKYNTINSSSMYSSPIFSARFSRP